jgi:hypothetical protein
MNNVIFAIVQLGILGQTGQFALKIAMVELNGGKEDVPKIVNVQAKTLKIETAILICVVIFSIFYLTSS